MNATRLALASIGGHAFRSAAVVLCALLVAGFALFTTLLMRGAGESLQLAIDRLGADIIVVPAGAEEGVETALLMGNPTQSWMPDEVAAKLAALEGVRAVSPQLYLATLTGAACCSVSNMFIIAYDPATDFTIRPWLEKRLVDGLDRGEVVAGQHISATEGDQNISVYGYLVTLKANLEPTGTGMDQTMFMSFDTARDIARLSKTQADKPLVIPERSISAALVKLQPGADSQDVAVRILQAMPGVVPIEAGDLFQSYRRQLTGLLRTMLVTLALTFALSLLLLGLVFTMASNERRRELGVLRAMGATRRYVFGSLLAEAAILGVIGAAAGIALVFLVVTLFQRLIIVSLGIPFVVPSLPELLAFGAVGMALTVVAVGVAAVYPALRVSRQEPASAMRE